MRTLTSYATIGRLSFIVHATPIVVRAPARRVIERVDVTIEWLDSEVSGVCQWAHALQRWYPGFELFAELRRALDGALTATELEELLRAIEHAAQNAAA